MGTGFSCALTFERDAWMGRMILALVVLPFSLSCAAATLAPRKKPQPFEKLTLPAAGKMPTREVWVTEGPARAAREQDPSSELTLAEGAEVRLDGRPCKYDDVPRGAEVIYLELGPDRKSIRKAHFRSKR
jgi:hypothetical protein